jgi:TP901 family phage tail tape measure protein
MAVATEVVARFTADISDVQSKMAAARGAFSAVGEAATFSSKRIAEVGQTMADVGAKMTVGLTLPLGGLALAASNAAMSFETSMNKIVGLVGIASDEVARMGDEVLAMAAATGKAPDELAGGLFVVTSAGLRGSEAMATLANSAKAGAAGLGQTNDIARAVAGALSAYGSEVLSASDATDAIVATARAGNFETSQFAAAIGRVLPFAEQAGASFQEMGGAVALLTRVNGNAAESITQIQALFRAVVVPTEEAKKALDEVGLSAQDLRDSIAEKGLPATLEMLDKALGGNREQLGKLLGSSEAASAAFQILGADARTIQETFGGVRNSAGLTAEAFGAVSQTAQFQVSQAMAELKATLIDLGEQFLPIIKSVMDFMQANLRAFNSLPGPIKTTILMFGALLAALGPILFVVGKLIVVFSTLLAAMLKLKAIQTLRAGFLALRGELAASRAAMKQTQTSIGMLGTAATTAKVAVVGSFKAIGAAAKGLLASLGPIGLAMLAVGAAVEIFIGRAAATEHHLSNLRDEIDLTTGKMTEAAKIFIASELRHNISQEDLAMMENYGISISGFIAALEQGGPALDAYRQKITAMQEAQKAGGGIGDTGFLNVSTVNSINTIVGTLDGMIGQYENAKVAAQDAAQSQVDAALAASDAQRGQAAAHRALAQEKRAADAAMTASQRSLDKALDSGVRAVEALSSAFEKMNEVISQEASRDSAIQGIKDLNATLEENGSALKGTSDAAMANRSAIRDAAQGWIDYAAAAKDPEEAQKRLAKGQDEIRAALKKQGIKPEQSDIFKVFKKQQSESKRTVDEFAAQREVAAQYGNDVGMNFIDGIIAELARRKEEVAAAAAAVTSGLTTGGNAGIDATSPSRDAMKIAGNFVDGITVGLRSRANKVREEGSKLGRGLSEAFAEALSGSSGSISGAINEVFGSIPTQSPLESLLGEKGAEKFVEDNAKALRALLSLGEALDRIRDKMFFAGEAFATLGSMIAKPFGRASEISEIFGSASDIDSVINGFLSIRDQIRQAYSVLTDASIVGAKAAARNRQEMNRTITAIRTLTEQAIALRREYDSVMTELASLEESYRSSVDETNKAFDAAERAAEEAIKAIEDRWSSAIGVLESTLKDANDAYEKENAVLSRLISERDQFLNSIRSGFRSFVNNLSIDSAAATKQIVKETQRLANGLTVTFEREIKSGGSARAIRETLQERLDAVREFSSNIRTLMERGLDPRLVQEFVTAGVSGAGDAAAALAAGSAEDLAEINNVQAGLLAATDSFAQYAAAQWHDVGIAQQEAIVAPLQVARDTAQAALDAANALREKELAAARAHLDKIRSDRLAALSALEAEYNAKRATLEAQAADLQAKMDAVAAEIEAKILKIVQDTATRSAEAGTKAAQKLLDGFKKRYPKVYSELNRLMDELAASMSRTATVTIRTVYEAVSPVKPPATMIPGRAMGGPVSARTAYLVGERGPELFIPGISGNIVPNSKLGNVPSMNGAAGRASGVTNITINVNAGMGADGSDIGRHIVDSLRQYERRNGPIPVSVTG